MQNNLSLDGVNPASHAWHMLFSYLSNNVPSYLQYKIGGMQAKESSDKIYVSLHFLQEFYNLL